MTLAPFLLAAAFTAAAAGMPSPPVGHGLSPWPLEGVVTTARADAAATPLLASTALTRAAYLPVIHGIVTALAAFQVANGSIIDPYEHVEIQYSTPCFAFAAAVVATQGDAPVAALLEPASRALDSALWQLGGDASAMHCASGHSNFFTYPSMMAFEILAPHAAPARLANWTKWLNQMNPSSYAARDGNWGLVAVAGEFVRMALHGFGNASQSEWWTSVLSAQMTSGVFTASGNYQDHSGSAGLSPLPYDTFPLKYMTVLVRGGYNTSSKSGGPWPWAADMQELTRRAGWTHLLMQSPWGEVMTGGRSSQHTWNEACSAVTYEVYAGLYAEQVRGWGGGRSTYFNVCTHSCYLLACVITRTSWIAPNIFLFSMCSILRQGDKASACMFKRAARMSLATVARWQNPTGEVQIVSFVDCSEGVINEKV